MGADGLFLDRETIEQLFRLVDGEVPRVGWAEVGGVETDTDAVRRHVEGVLGLETVDVTGVRGRGFTVALDCVRGAGGTILPTLLERLGCRVVGLDLEPDGRFPRPPEPVPVHLERLGELVRDSGADLGMAVDPDGDRLAITDEGGRAIGEDYTLAFAIRAVLARRRGPVVANLSTSLVVDDAAAAFGVDVVRAPVGEANVAGVMREVGAVVGGEGNGGVMLPALHLGRDAPLAAALVLTLLAERDETVSALVAGAPRYEIVKDKGPRGSELQAVYEGLAKRWPDAARDRQDGLRLAWSDRWLHVRPSGTEPIVRLIAEAPTAEDARALVREARTLLEGANTASCVE